MHDGWSGRKQFNLRKMQQQQQHRVQKGGLSGGSSIGMSREVSSRVAFTSQSYVVSRSPLSVLKFIWALCLVCTLRYGFSFAEQTFVNEPTLDPYHFFSNMERPPQGHFKSTSLVMPGYIRLVSYLCIIHVLANVLGEPFSTASRDLCLAHSISPPPWLTTMCLKFSSQP